MSFEKEWWRWELLGEKEDGRERWREKTEDKNERSRENMIEYWEREDMIKKKSGNV